MSKQCCYSSVMNWLFLYIDILLWSHENIISASALYSCLSTAIWNHFKSCQRQCCAVWIIIWQWKFAWKHTDCHMKPSGLQHSAEMTVMWFNMMTVRSECSFILKGFLRLHGRSSFYTKSGVKLLHAQLLNYYWIYPLGLKLCSRFLNFFIFWTFWIA